MAFRASHIVNGLSLSLFRLLRGNRAQQGNRKLAVVVRLIHGIQPEREHAQRDQQPYGEREQRDPPAEMDEDADRDAPHHAECDTRNAVDDGLHGVKTNKPVLLVGIEHKEDDPRNRAQQIRKRRGLA